MNPVLDGQTRALKFIHYRDEKNEPGFLFPYVGMWGVCLDGIFRFIIKLGMNQVLDGQTTAQRQGETFRIGNSISSYGPVWTCHTLFVHPHGSLRLGLGFDCVGCVFVRGGRERERDSGGEYFEQAVAELGFVAMVRWLAPWTMHTLLQLEFFFFSSTMYWGLRNGKEWCVSVFCIAGSQEGYSQDGCPDTCGKEKGVLSVLLLLKNGSCKWGWCICCYQ